ncbi:dsDNA nuclease domain-containing protein [Kitasatospora sp. NPDC058162]|uniref:dsDNA nuclease domain-containing protein n=1 Tax=Kitasatospora sp. NPDC058162 TaxID=3346362 RepID=UPI0036D87706
MSDHQISPIEAFLNTPPPEDSGAETASRYFFQYQCAARHCLAMVSNTSIKAVICEWHTDFSIEFNNGILHLISVKHRELSAGPWPLSDLWGKGGLRKLFDRWRESPTGSRCRLATNGVMKGGKDNAAKLASACANRDEEALTNFSTEAAQRLSCSEDEAREFLFSLDLEVGIPDRTTMRADSIINLAPNIIPDFRERGLDLGKAWDSLVNLVASASRDFDSRDYADGPSLSNIDGLQSPRLISARIRRRTITREVVLRAISETPSQSKIRKVSNLEARRPRARFFGRDNDIESITASLSTCDSSCPAVAVVGMSGIGKTELLRQFATAMSEDFDFSWWLVGDSWTSVASGLTELGSELGVSSDSPSSQAPVNAVIEIVSRAHGLLIIDGAMATPELIEFASRAGNSRLLLSSTDQTWANYLPVVDLRPLAVSDSIQLLKSSLPKSEDGDLKALCASLGGHPLALLQAAGYMGVTGIDAATYSSILRNRARELMGRASPVEHAGVAAAWDVTALNLKEHHPHAFKLLQVFSHLADQPFPKELFSWKVPSVRTKDEVENGIPTVYRQSLARAAEREHESAASMDVREAFADPLHLHDAIFALRRFSLLDVGSSGLKCHSLIQALVRQSSEEETEAALHAATYMLYKVTHLTPTHSDYWSHYSHVLPHFESLIDHLAGSGCMELNRVLFCSSIAEYLNSVGVRSGSLRYAQESLGNVNLLDSSDIESALYARGVAIEAMAGSDKLDEALDLANETLNLAKISEADGSSLAIINSRLASLYHLKGDLKSSLAALESCETFFASSSIKSDPHSVLAIRSNRANLARELGDAKLAILELLGCIEDFGDEVSDGTLSTLHCNLSLSYLEVGDYEAALEASMTALEYDRNISHGTHANTARDYNNAGLALFELGLFKEAHEAFARSAEMHESLEEFQTMRSLTVKMNLARALEATGSHQEAKVAMEQVLREQEKLVGSSHRDVAVTLVNLATVYNSLGLYANSVKACKRAIDIDKMVYGDRHPELIVDLNNLATSLMFLERPAAAAKWLILALDISMEAFGGANSRTARCLENLANIEASCGEVSTAKARLEESVSIYENSVGPHHPDTKRAKESLKALKPSQD